MQFSDVGVGDYAAEYVLCMRVLGLSVGGVDGGYGPDAELSRGQMASFLVRLWRDVLGRACPDDVVVPFLDVAGTTHEASIGCLYGLGIAMGTTATTYAPGDRLAASQVSRFLLRVYEKTGGRCDAFGGELERGLGCLVGLGVIPSEAEGGDGGSVTRAQMAVYVVGLWHNVSGRGVAPLPPAKGTIPAVGGTQPEPTENEPPGPDATPPHPKQLQRFRRREPFVCASCRRRLFIRVGLVPTVRLSAGAGTRLGRRRHLRVRSLRCPPAGYIRVGLVPTVRLSAGATT